VLARSVLKWWDSTDASSLEMSPGVVEGAETCKGSPSSPGPPARSRKAGTGRVLAGGPAYVPYFILRVPRPSSAWAEFFLTVRKDPEPFAGSEPSTAHEYGVAGLACLR